MSLTYILQDNIIASGWMGGLKTKSAGSPTFFLPQAMLGSLHLPIFFFTNLNMGAFSQANHIHPHLA